MDKAESELFDDCLQVETSLPFACMPGQMLEPARQQRAVRFLELVHGFEDARMDLSDDLSGNGQDTALQRLEVKLDFAMEMLGSLLQIHRHPPPAVVMRLCIRGLRLLAPMPMCSDHGVVALHLNSMVPEPLELAVRELKSDDAGTLLAFENMSKGAEACLERAIFKMHRRAIAAARQGSNP